MGIFSGLASTVGGAISKAVSGISRTFNSVGKVFKSVTETTIGIVGNLLKGIGRFFGFLSENETLEERGDKVLQAKEEGIVPEDFESFEEYQKKIDEFKIDEEKSKKIDPDKKLAAGMGYVALGIDKIFGSKALLMLGLVFKAPVLFPLPLITTYLQAIRNGKISAIDIVNFYQGKEMKINDKKVISEYLIETEMEVEKINKKDALKRIIERQKEVS